MRRRPKLTFEALQRLRQGILEHGRTSRESATDHLARSRAAIRLSKRILSGLEKRNAG